MGAIVPDLGALYGCLLLPWRTNVGLFRKSQVQPNSTDKLRRRNPNFVDPPNAAGVLRTRLIADLGQGERIAFWVCVNEAIISAPEYEELQNHFGTYYALEELQFALGITEQPDLPTFTTDTGAEVRLGLSWSPPVARSSLPLDVRLRDCFEVDEQPLGEIHGILKKGLSFWTLTYTNQAVYALSETDQKSERIPWTDVTEIRWRNYDLGIGQLAEGNVPSPTLHEFFNARYPHTWREFVEGLEECWVRNGDCTTVSYPLTETKSIRAHLFKLHGRVCVSHLPLADRHIYEEMKVEGRKTEIDSWVQTHTAGLLRGNFPESR